MPTAIHQVTVDALDPYKQAQFWSRIFGTAIDDEDVPGDPEVLVNTGPGVPGLLFVQVPEHKTVKNRVHLDLMPEDTRDGEVERLLAVGATFVGDFRRPDGTGWVVLADPEGNEFCVERSAAEREAARRTADDAQGSPS